MVNTEHKQLPTKIIFNYNILNIVVNTEPWSPSGVFWVYYNILNIVVNTEQFDGDVSAFVDYNILNIVVNTEP